MQASSQSAASSPDFDHYEDYQVDTPAMPVGEWVINPEPLPFGRTSTIPVKVWVSAQGAIERWQVLGKNAPPQAETVLKDLNRTVLNPARIGDQPVASIRYIELIIERTYQD